MNREMKTKTVVEEMWEKCGVFTTSGWFAVTICTILTAGGAFLMYAFENHGGTGEPFAWFDGASAWPSIAIILFATLLSIHFIIKANSDLRRNADELTEEFRLESPDEADRKSTSFFGWEASPSKYVILRGSNTDQVQHTRPEEKVDIVTLWQRYLCRGRLWMRLGRAAPMTLLYFTALFFLLSLIGRFPTPNIRGHFYFPCLIVPAIFAFLLLTFVVIDAILLHERFLKQLTDKKTCWPDATFEKYDYRVKPNRPINENDLADYWDILLIARRTEAVGKQIYYLFIILSLLIVAWLGYFDNWTWPPEFIVALCVHFSVALFAAWRLPRGARKYRDKVLERMNRRKRQALMSAEKTSEATDTMIEEVQSIHQGAFSYLWEQPAVRALLLPSGGILAALIQYLHR
jgi:hypothetical protein